MDRPRGHYAVWNKPDTEGQKLCESPLDVESKIVDTIEV
jgi:hypothetical protein